MGKTVILWLYLIMELSVIECYRILGIFPHNGRSHHIMFSRLIEELSERNHEVTVINYYPMRKMKNLRQISLQNLNHNNVASVDLQRKYKDLPFYFREFYFARRTAETYARIANDTCHNMFTHPELLKMVTRNDTKFDLIIVEQFVTDCGLGLVHHFKSPAIGIAAHVLKPWTYARFGIPNNPAFVPNHFMGTGTKLSVWKKLKSVLINWFFNIYFKYIIQRNDLETIWKLLPDTPDLDEVAKDLSLLMINQHFALTGSRLFPANVVEVGGMHIKRVPLQDKELLKFMEEAPYGVVYVSLGTVARTTSLPQHKVHALLAAMRGSPHRFLWKREDANLTDAPPNLMIRHWMPQLDILCHPKVVAFISHAGMLSTAEAAHCGVPVLGVPLFGDQFANAASARESGLGVTLPYRDLHERRLADALRDLLRPERIAEAKRVSALWRDRPSPPMETAVYWAEYVARHGGAPQLRPPTMDLPLYQYLMLDVLLVAAAVVLVALYCSLKICIYFDVEHIYMSYKSFSTKGYPYRN